MADPGEPANFTAVIADDDPDIAHLVQVAVRRAGGSVLTTVHDGDAALEEIRRAEPDVALLDVSMPGLTGVEVCRLIRHGAGPDDLGHGSRTASTLVILLSAAVHPDAIALGLDAGAHSYIAKPFSPRSLAAHLRQALEDRTAAP